jgi:signal transduction histidine kinase
MKISIRNKMFITFTALIVGYVILSWTMNLSFLEKYYTYKKMSMLKDTLNDINEKYNGNVLDIGFELATLERKDGINITIEDKDSHIKYESFVRRPEMPRKDIDQYNEAAQKIDNIPEDKKIPRKPTDEEIMIHRMTNTRLKADFIIASLKLNNEDTITLTSSISTIKEGVSISNEFVIVTGIITVIIGSLAIAILSTKFTKPIREMKDIAHRTANLDFNKKYTITSRDEFGELGESINSMSSQLEKSIFKLKENNEILKEDIERKTKQEEERIEFTHSVAHELKTPIALIQGYAEGLKVNVNQDEENKNYYCDVIIDETAKMDKLVKQLMEIFNIGSGGIDFQMENFEICDLIKDVIKKNYVKLKQKDVKLEFKGFDFGVYGDPYWIEQAISNYITNAINYVDDKKIIKVDVEQVNDKIRVSVYNSGIKIDQENKDRIWESFYKVDKARTREYGGTGLGLSIVKGIQTAHHNKYGFQNIDDGVKFWFELDKGKE